MDEGKTYILWYRLRGLGLLCLCSLVFFMGAHIAQRDSIAVSVTADGRELPVCCVQTDRKQAALTFDTVSGSGDVPELLGVLAARGVKATFFVTGEWAQTYPEEARQIAAAGHDLGSLGQSHRNMRELTKSEAQQEIQAAHEAVRAVTGAEMKLFRAPYGSYDNALLQTVRLSGYLPVQWDVDSEDWKSYGTDSVLREVAQNRHLGNGSIILMHSGAEDAVQSLDGVIAALQEQGYELVPVSQLVRWGDYHIDGEGRQIPD